MQGGSSQNLCSSFQFLQQYFISIAYTLLAFNHHCCCCRLFWAHRAYRPTEQRAYRKVIAVFSVRYDHPCKDRRYSHKKEVVGESLMAQIADRLAGFALRRIHKEGIQFFRSIQSHFPDFCVLFSRVVFGVWNIFFGEKLVCGGARDWSTKRSIETYSMVT